MLTRAGTVLLLLLLVSADARAQIADVVTTGTLDAAGQVVVLIAPGRTTGRVQLRGTWTATLVFEGTVEPINPEWEPIQALNNETNEFSTTTQAPGIYTVSLVAFRSVRVRVSQYVSGTIAVTWRASGQGGNALAWIANQSDSGQGGGDVNVTNASIAVTGPVTDAQLRAAAVPVSVAGTLSVSGPLTDAQLRATSVPVTGPLTDGQLRASAVPVSGPLTDTQLRASAVPISGAVGVSGSVAVTGPLTDTQLRATPLSVTGTFFQATQPVSGTFWQTTQPVSIASMPSTPVTGTFWQGTQPVSIAAAPVTPVTDNGGSITVDGVFWPATQPVSGTVSIGVTPDANGSLFVRQDSSQRFSCSMTSTAVTSTVITGCIGAGGTTAVSPGAGLARYITAVQYNSSIIGTTANFLTLQYGTGTTCGTGTTVVWRQANQAAFAPIDTKFDPPIRLGTATDLCFLHPGAGTRLINVQGFIAP